MRAARQDSQDQRLGMRPDAARLAGKPFRVPLGVTPVRARHVVGVGTMTRPAIAPCMCRHPSAAVVHLDGARGGAGVDLFADQRMRHRIIKACDLDMIVNADTGEVPLGILIVLFG